MVKKSYQLVNPVIEGTFNDIVESTGEPIKGAEKIWKRFTEHVAGHVPIFMFTMKDTQDNSLYHFEVKEKGSNGTYSIKELKNLKVGTDDLDEYHKNIDSTINKNNALGGGRKRYKYGKDSSSSSDSCNDESCVEFDPRLTTPIAMFHYTSRFYHQHDGHVFEHKSTMNPEPVLIKPTPVYKVYPVYPSALVANVISTKHNYTTIPVFKAPLLPRIIIWN